MKIAAIRATPILVPLEAPYVWSYGALDGFTKNIGRRLEEMDIILRKLAKSLRMGT